MPRDPDPDVPAGAEMSSVALDAGADEAELLGGGSPPPLDKRNTILLAAGLMGAGFLLPFNTYITAADFLEQRYQRYDPEFYIALVYMLGSATMVCLNIVFMNDRYSIISRIRFGYVAFIIALSMFPVIEESVVGGDISRSGGYWALLGSVLLTSMGGGVQQSSLYGLCGILGSKYTLGLMVGESLAGLVVSIMRIFTKISYGDSEDGVQRSTYLFLSLSITFVLCCTVVSELVERSSFKRWHFRNFQKLKAMDEEASRATQVYLGNQIQPAADDAVGDGGHDDAAPALAPQLSKYQLAKMLKFPMLSVFSSFVVTLSVFPGVSCMAPSEKWGDWMPILAITAFNLGDLVGKLLPFSPIERCHESAFTQTALLKFTLARLVFIPLLVLCASTGDDEDGKPVLTGEGWALAFNFLLGVTGGFSATLAMASGPALVSDSHRDLAGIIMTMALLTGLTTGVVLSIALLKTIQVEY